MSSVIDHGSFFTSLPREYYLSPEIYQEEISKVFDHEWVMVGVVGMIPTPGEYFEAPANGESLMIIRGDDNEIRAFYNTCRHRGSLLCGIGDSGKKGKIVCPYHSWSWERDGALKVAPGMKDGDPFDFSNYPLKQAHVELLEGMIWVNTSLETPEPLLDQMTIKPDLELIRLVRPDQIKLAHEERYKVAANWKIMLENNTECYHCAATHPSLQIACDFEAWFHDNERNENGAYFPLRPGMKTFSMDGEWVSKKPLGDTWQPEQFATGLMNFPMFSAMTFFADHAVNIYISPDNLGNTTLVCQWYVHQDAVENVDYDVEKLIRVFDNTNREDYVLAQNTAIGVNSRRFTPGPDNPTREAELFSALSAYLKLMGRP